MSLTDQELHDRLVRDELQDDARRHQLLGEVPERPGSPSSDRPDAATSEAPPPEDPITEWRKRLELAIAAADDAADCCPSPLYAIRTRNWASKGRLLLKDGMDGHSYLRGL